jgi:hypothetical protein
MRQPKYRNKRTEVNGVLFDSQAEARRYLVLRLQEEDGQISQLRRQVSFELVPPVRLLGSKRATPAIRYVADFAYLTAEGRQVIEDVKGMLTPVYRIKRHLMKHKYNIDILETK